MDLQSDDTGDNLLGDSSTETSDDRPMSSKTGVDLTNKSPFHQWKSPYNFDQYVQVYEEILTLFLQGKHQRWSDIFQQMLKNAGNPHQLLYMFLDHTLDKINSKKHKLVVPFIEQFKQVNISDTQVQLDEQIRRNILAKICHQCIFSQLEAVIDVFQLRSIDNQALAVDFIQNHSKEKDLIFISQLVKLLRLLESDAIPFARIIVPLILQMQWETIRFVVGDEQKLQERLLQTIDQLISTNKDTVRRVLSHCSMSDKINQIDTRSLKRAARKLLKQFNMNLNDFPNLAAQEKLTFLKTLFVRKYLEGQETDDQSWKEQIKELVGEHHELQVRLVDLLVDYSDVDAAVYWTHVFRLEDGDIPEQVRIRREEKLQGDAPTRLIPHWSTKPVEQSYYQPTVVSTDITYIELDSEVDPFLHRLECARCDVGSHLPFVGFDCESFVDPTQRTLSTQIVSILQLATYHPSRNQTFYGVFDMLALRLQMDMSALTEFAERVFCSQDFILLTYNYACDTSSLLENYPSMHDALMQGTAVIDLFRIQQHILEHCPEVFPYYGETINSKARGLSELVRLCFGQTLNKALQTSDWRRRPLKQSQLNYSVLDARVLVDIALLIDQRTHSLNIPWSWSDLKGYTWTDRAFKKRTSHL